MSYPFRNFLFVLFVLVFIIMTIFFSLSASGYKVSVTGLLSGQDLIQKTGILAIDSKPRGAEISLSRQSRDLIFDNEIKRNKKILSPSKIRGLLPGTYLLSLELDGYWPWQQKFQIYPGQSTYMEDIVLFKKEEAFNFFKTTAQNFELNTRSQKIILKDDFKVIDLKTGQEVFSDPNLKDLDFLDGRRLLLNNSLIFDEARKNYQDLSFLATNSLSKLKIRANNLFYLQDSGLFKYHLSSKQQDNVFLIKNIIDYEFYNGFYFLIISEEQQSFLRIYSYKNKELLKEIELPFSLDYEIINPGASDFVYIYNPQFKSVHIVKTSSHFNSFWAVLDNVSGLDLVDANNLIYHSDSEIYSFNTVLAEKFLISRFETEIKNLLWHPKNYLIFSTDKDIKILDLRYNKSLLTISSLDEVLDLALDKSNNILYFSGSQGQLSGLFSILIQ